MHQAECLGVVAPNEMLFVVAVVFLLVFLLLVAVLVAFPETALAHSWLRCLQRSHWGV